jgi:hypothetical protein
LTRAVRVGQRALPCCLSWRASIIPTLLALLSLFLILLIQRAFACLGRSLKAYNCFRTPLGAQIFPAPLFEGPGNGLRSFLAGCFEVGKFGAASLESRAGQRPPDLW